jgi:hypothetical protein
VRPKQRFYSTVAFAIVMFDVLLSQIITLLDQLWQGLLYYERKFSARSRPHVIFSRLYNMMLDVFSTSLQCHFASSWVYIQDISNTYMPFPQLFAKGKSLKSEGIGMPRDMTIASHCAMLRMDNALGRLFWVGYS